MLTPLNFTSSEDQTKEKSNAADQIKLIRDDVVKLKDTVSYSKLCFGCGQCVLFVWITCVTFLVFIQLIP